MSEKSNLTPTRKVAAGAAIGIPVGIVLVWAINSVVMSFGGSLPAEVATAIGSICSFAAFYMVPDSR